MVYKKEFEFNKEKKRNVGMHFERISCPCCGWSIPKHMAKFNKPIEDIMLIEIREGGGYGSGFHRVGGMTLEQAEESGDYDDLIEQIRQRCKEILKTIGK